MIQQRQNQTATCQPPVGQLATADKLREQAHMLWQRLATCDICPHQCGVNRLQGEIGRCGVGRLARVASFCDHHGEEPVLSGTRGAGTVFLAGCNLHCVYCQNHQISQPEMQTAPEYSCEALAEVYLALQQQGCHNLAWVSPTHLVPQLVDALLIAMQHGFQLPVVYNTNGYDQVDTLHLLRGMIEIYLPDLKYADPTVAMQLSGAPNYPDVAMLAIQEMYRQVGNLTLDDNGLARQGVIVRHLVLPNGLAGTRAILQRLADEVSPTITVSLMAQYYPTHHAKIMSLLQRTITVAEYDEALEAFTEAGLENGWAQELQSAPENYQPDFNETHPFA